MGVFRNIKETGELSAIQDQLASLKREFATLEAEWSNMHDKLRRMMMRVSKRAEIAEKLSEANGATSDEPEFETMGHTGPLTPAQKRIQQQILRQRAGLAT